MMGNLFSKLLLDQRLKAQISTSSSSSSSSIFSSGNKGTGGRASLTAGPFLRGEVLFPADVPGCSLSV